MKRIFIRFWCWFVGHRLCIFSGDSFYSCLNCGKKEFEGGERIETLHTPLVGFGDDGYKVEWNGNKFILRHGFTKENWPEKTRIIPIEVVK